MQANHLARAAPRSEHDPDLEAAAVEVAMHPVTGHFSEPTHESAFAAQLFRLAFTSHALLMTLVVAVMIHVTVVAPAPALRVIWGTTTLCAVLGLVGRVLLHRMHDSARSQRVGSWCWTALLMSSCIIGMGNLLVAPASACELRHLATAGQLLGVVLAAILNGSHGMRFRHKWSMIAVLLANSLAIIAVCDEAALVPMLFEMGATVVGATTMHMAELF